MNISRLLECLRKMEKESDLPVFILAGKYEYGVADVQYAKEGPLPHLKGIQTQVLPARIVLISDSDVPPIHSSDA
jgi:hypothetical protein